MEALFLVVKVSIRFFSNSSVASLLVDMYLALPAQRPAQSTLKISLLAIGFQRLLLSSSEETNYLKSHFNRHGPFSSRFFEPRTDTVGIFAEIP